MLISDIKVQEANDTIFDNVNYVINIDNVTKSEFKLIHNDINNALHEFINEDNIDASYCKNRFTSVFTSYIGNIEDVKSALSKNSKSGYFNVKDGGRLSKEDGVIYELNVSYKQNIISRIYNLITPRFMLIIVLMFIGAFVCYPSIVDLYEYAFNR